MKKNKKTLRSSFLSLRTRSHIEFLESRLLLTTFPVTSTADSDADGTLRSAIIAANNSTDPNGDKITFDFDLSTGTETIVINTPLPEITDDVVIDGARAGFPGVSVYINGYNGTDNVTDGLVLSGSGAILNLGVIGFMGDAIRLQGDGHSKVQGCMIGTMGDPSEAASYWNWNGITVTSDDNQIGGADPGQGNWIAASNNVAITVNGDNTTIAGNIIGIPDISFDGDGNDAGILIDGASNTLVGGPSAGARNVISGNWGIGLQIIGNGTGNTIQGNYIGLDSTGSSRVVNSGDGIMVGNNEAPAAVSGVTIVGNVVSSSLGDGIGLINASGISISGNYIGTDSSGLATEQGAEFFGSIADGINVAFGSHDNHIGLPGAPNVIAGNFGNGIRLSKAGTGNVIQGNYIGIGADGVTPLIGYSEGVRIEDTSGTTIGGVGTGEGNIIANSMGSNGVKVTVSKYGVAINNSIRGNSIFQNELLGISLRPETGASLGVPVLNGSISGDGPNHFQYFPELTSADFDASNYHIAGSMTALGAHTLHIDFYSNLDVDANFGEGQTFLGSRDIVASGAGTFPFNFTLPVKAGDQQYITATATDENGNTSEFSQWIFAKADTKTTLVSSRNPLTYGQTATLTAAVSVLPDVAAQPSGSVTFKTGSTVLGTSPLVNGVAKLDIAPSAGTYPIEAVFTSDDENVLGSTSPKLSQFVRQASSKTVLTSSANPSLVGQLVTFTADVTATSGIGNPTGKVTFKDGNTVLATVNLVNGRATFSTSSLSAGSHSVVAAYSGDVNFVASTTTPLSQSVRNATSTILSGPSSATVGTPATLTATPTTGATGYITFKDGDLVLGRVAIASGKAVLNIVLAAGNHSILAVYEGNSLYAPSTSSVLYLNVH